MKIDPLHPGLVAEKPFGGPRLFGVRLARWLHRPRSLAPSPARGEAI